MSATRAEKLDLKDDDLWAQSKHYAHGGALKFDSIEDGDGLDSSDLSARARQRTYATWICSSDSSAFLPRIRAVHKVLGLQQALWVLRKVDGTTTYALGFPLLCVWLRPTRVLSSRRSLGSSTSSTSSTGDFAEPSQEGSLSVDLKESLWSSSFRTWTNKCK